MSLFELFILAVGLSMDAFAVSVCKGLSAGHLRPVHNLTCGLYFGGFQAMMPLLGWLLGIQFQTLFEDGLYWKLGKHADQLAEQIRNTLQECGFSFLARSHTNQVFPILPDDLCEKLSRKYMYCYQERIDNSHSAIRFCTSWATRPENVDALCQDIRSLSAK